MPRSIDRHALRRRPALPFAATLFAALLLGAVVALWGAVAWESPSGVSARGAVAQEDAPPPAPPPGPSVGERVVALVVAFDSVAAAAGEAVDDAGWQRADAAFNLALDALDVHQGPLVAQVGEPAAAVFAGVEARLAPLAGALDGNDVVGVRVIVAQIRDLLDDLAPVAAGDDVAPQQAAILQDWQATLERAGLLLTAARWRDARNEAIALLDDIAQRGPTVARLSPVAEAAVRDAGLFALRLRAAAIDQSAADGAAAGRAFERALKVLLVESGAAPAPTPTPVATGPTRFRGYQVVAAPGEQVELPIVAAAVPQIGLGAFDLTVAWSPVALQLTGVDWLLDAGVHQRDDAAGRVRLSLPQAPIGPSGDVVVASLRFDVLPGPFDARDLLPPDELRSIDEAIEEAVRLTRTADRPKAAAVLGRAYYDFVEGRDVPGGLYDELARHGLADGLAAALKGALEVASREEAESDEVVIAVARLRRTLVDALDGYGRALAAGGGMPVRLDVRSARDTTGARLSLLPAIAGEVIAPAEPTVVVDLPTATADEAGAGGDVAAGQESVGEEDPTGAQAAEDGDAAAEDAATAADEDASGAGAGDPEPGARRDAPFPRGLIAALLLAAIVGLVVTAFATGGRGDEPG